MASAKRKKKPKVKPAGGPACPRCGGHGKLFWHGRRELCEKCIDAIRTPLETEPITAGSLLRGTLELLRRVGMPALGITLAFQLPLAFISLRSEAGVAIGVIWPFLSLIGVAAVMDLALQKVTDEQTSIGEAFKTALRCYVGLVFASIISELIVLLMLLLLIVPGVLRFLSYAIVLPLIVDGDARGTDALAVSTQRMKGHRRPAFVVFLFLYLPSIVWFALNTDVALAGLAPDAGVPDELATRTALYPLIDSVLAIPVTLLPVVLHLKLRKPAPA